MWNLRTLSSKLLVATAATTGLIATIPVSAASNGYIAFTDDFSSSGALCVEANIGYDVSFTGTIDDGGGQDWIAILTLDGNGNVLDNDFETVSVGLGYIFDDDVDLGVFPGLEARPIWVVLYDIPGGAPADANTSDAVNFVLTQGTVMASDSIDPADFVDDCENLPLVGAEGAAFDPGDDRINPDAHAPVAIYCRENSAVEVLNIDANGNGSQAFLLTSEDISAGAAGSIVTQVGNVSLYKLADGRLQINAVLLDGKGYAFLWDACPVTYSETYTIENGLSSLLIARSY